MAARTKFQTEDLSVIERLNTRIAELVKASKPEEIVEIMIGSETSLLRASQQQQQQQQQQVKRPTQAMEGTASPE